MRAKFLVISFLLLFLPVNKVFAHGGGSGEAVEPLGVEKDATIFTQEANKYLLKVLPFKDTEDFKNA